MVFSIFALFIYMPRFLDAVPVFCLLAFFVMSAIIIFDLSTFFAFFVFAHSSSTSFLLAVLYLSLHISILEKQSFIKFNQRVIKTLLSKDLVLISILLFIKHFFPKFFLLSYSKKQLFFETLDFDYWLLANDYIEKKIVLSFVSCQYFQAIKANRI